MSDHLRDQVQLACGSSYVRCADKQCLSVLYFPVYPSVIWIPSRKGLTLRTWSPMVKQTSWSVQKRAFGFRPRTTETPYGAVPLRDSPLPLMQWFGTETRIGVVILLGSAHHE